jgi:hyaluronan synthase
MRHEYRIPRVTIKRPRSYLWVTGVGAVVLLLAVRHVWFIMSWGKYRFLAVLWMTYFVITAFQWMAAWLERPYSVTPVQQARLDRMNVTVNIPVFNEDPEVLDRVLYAVFRQTRLPNKVEVVDDGSKVSYDVVRDWWMHHHPRHVELSWVRQENAGKKLAQARTFCGDLADIFITLDSDTVLEERAIEEGLKPFADRRVHSVAGMELAWNHDWNLLTRLNSCRQLTWELVTCSAQNVMQGNVLINRGTFALYRGNMVRDVLPAYVGETFLGRSIKLGDDTFLTTMALCRGRAVQQPSAVCLAMYPENLSHHLRQWTRWMRGTTLRTFWRLRYLRLGSWAWVYSVISLWWYVASIAITVMLVVQWPASASYTATMLAVGTLWAWAMATRIFTIHRSDQSFLGRLGSVALAPAAVFWVLAVLRFVRIYGTVTFLRQGWTTRTEVEVRAEKHSDEQLNRSDLSGLKEQAAGRYSGVLTETGHVGRPDVIRY